MTVIIFLLSASASFAQQSKIDSLLTAKETAQDTAIIFIFIDLSKEYAEIDSIKSLEYAMQALSLSKKINDKVNVAGSLNNLGNLYKNYSNYEKSLEYYHESLSIYEEMDNIYDIAMTTNNIGVIYMHQGNYAQSLKYFIEALKMLEKFERNNSNEKIKNLMASLQGNIGILYAYRGDFEKSLEYFFNTLKILENLGDKNKIAMSLNGIANIYYFQTKYDQSIEYHKKALAIREGIDDKYGIALSLNNIGSIYREQGDFDKSIKYYLRSLKISEETGNKNNSAMCLINIGETYDLDGKYSSALKYQEQGLKLAKEIGAKDLVVAVCQTLSATHEKINDYQQSLYYHKLYTQLNDSIFNIENSKQIAEMSEKYESEKKEKQIEIQKLELNRNRILQYALGGGVLMLLLLSFVVYNRYRLKRKANVLLATQKQVIETKNKDITDSIRYAERIQQAILPPIEEIKKTLPESFILFKPKDIVSGDFYFYAKVRESIIIAACDCTGHGVPGAFMSMIGNSLLNEIVNDRSITNAAEVLNQLRDGVIHAFGDAGVTGEAKDGMDMALCAIKRNKDNDTVNLQFAGAYNPLYIVRNGKASVQTSQVLKTCEVCDLEEIKADKQPVGYHFGKQTPFTNHEIQLQKGDTVYIFSDGYQDQFGGPKGKKFRPKQFRELLCSMQDRSMSEQYDILDKTIEEWKGDEEQVDDILVIGVRV